MGIGSELSFRCYRVSVHMQGFFRRTIYAAVCNRLITIDLLLATIGNVGTKPSCFNVNITIDLL